MATDPAGPHPTGPHPNGPQPEEPGQPHEPDEHAPVSRPPVRTGRNLPAAIGVGAVMGGLVILTLIWRLRRSKAPPPELPAASAGPTFEW